MTSESSNTGLRIAVCVGGTSTDLAVVDARGEILEELSLPTHVGGELMDACKTAEDRIGFTEQHWDAFRGASHAFSR